MSHTHGAGVVSLSALSLPEICEERRRLAFVHACMVGFPGGANWRTVCPSGEDLEQVRRELDLLNLLIAEQQGCGYHSKCENVEVA